MRIRHLILLFAVAVPGLVRAVESELGLTYRELATLCDSRELSPVSVAEASWLAHAYYSMKGGVPDNRVWFRQSKTIGQTLVSAVYLVIYGGTNDLAVIRQEFETNRVKRIWLRALLGNEEKFKASMDSGTIWWPLTLMMPSTEGCRTLSTLCLESSDALVRRGGMYCGYWFASPAYWKRMKQLLNEEPDELNRMLVKQLIEKAASSAR